MTEVTGHRSFANTRLGHRADTAHSDAFLEFGRGCTAKHVRTKIGALPAGAPSFLDFLDELANMKERAAAGADMVEARAWRYCPHWLKTQLYDLFLARFKSCEWHKTDVAEWQ